MFAASPFFIGDAFRVIPDDFAGEAIYIILCTRISFAILVHSMNEFLFEFSWLQSCSMRWCLSSTCSFLKFKFRFLNSMRFLLSS